MMTMNKYFDTTCKVIHVTDSNTQSYYIVLTIGNWYGSIQSFAHNHLNTISTEKTFLQDSSIQHSMQSDVYFA